MSEASLVWKVLGKCIGCMDGGSRAGPFCDEEDRTRFPSHTPRH